MDFKEFRYRYFMTRQYIQIHNNENKYLKSFKLFTVDLTKDYKQVKVFTCKVSLFEAERALQHNNIDYSTHIYYENRIE
jgi:hypothetical protein